jgi:hypothetical protein
MKENIPKENKLSRMLIKRLVTKFVAIDDMVIREDQGLQELMILFVKWRL